MKQGVGIVVCGDVSDIVAAFEPNYFDGCLCDPPYGLKFMGKSWDHGVPSSEVWEKVREVLRPGAGVLAFGGTRTFHRLAVAIEDAGLEVRDTLCWLYGSGFPKSLDVSKAIDKEARGFPQGTNRRDPSNPNAGKFKTQRTEGKRGEADKGQHFGAGPGQFMREASSKRDYKLTVDSALPWAGYGTALKPAWEPIILAMAPLTGTYASNALEHGVAGLNVDGCRVAANGDKLGGGAEKWQRGSDGWDRPWRHDPAHQAEKAAHTRENVARAESLGRWPANVVLDEEAGRVLDEQSGVSKSTGGRIGKKAASAVNNAPSKVYSKGDPGFGISIVRVVLRPATATGGVYRTPSSRHLRPCFKIIAQFLSNSSCVNSTSHTLYTGPLSSSPRL